ncbi:hypothetical protein G6011_00593 [Alternaria panax]|uniref:Uncharacterized protein n=1 Tax=Alternaria panax TaxID=48097 RepID=A0AAD4NUW5_9PLEO|nr:hypothetical protein G6011_00593 [Alternaria panax]
MREIEVRDEKTGRRAYGYHPHTYFAIVIDSFVQVPRFSSENTMHRSDILTDALCRGGKVQNGHGMLLYGPRLEYYTFDCANEWICPDSDDEEIWGQDMEFDMRITSLKIIDAAFRSIAVRDVVYVPAPEVIAEEDVGSANIDDDMEE